MKYEKGNPQTAPILQAFAKALLSKPAAPPPGVPERLSYYKCNMDECFYCLDCQVIHNDANVCPPLVYEAKRKLAVAATPVAE